MCLAVMDYIFYFINPKLVTINYTKRYRNCIIDFLIPLFSRISR